MVKCLAPCADIELLQSPLLKRPRVVAKLPGPGASRAWLEEALADAWSPQLEVPESRVDSGATRRCMRFNAANKFSPTAKVPESRVDSRATSRITQFNAAEASSPTTEIPESHGDSKATSRCIRFNAVMASPTTDVPESPRETSRNTCFNAVITSSLTKDVCDAVPKTLAETQARRRSIKYDAVVALATLEATTSGSACKRQVTSPMQSVHAHPLPSAPWKCNSRALLRGMELGDFKNFKHKEVSFGSFLGLSSASASASASASKTIVIGPNSSGKTSLMDALQFALLNKTGQRALGLIRRSEPRCFTACVTVYFECNGFGRVALQRQLCTANNDEGTHDSFYVGVDGGSMTKVSEQTYMSWISQALCWIDDEVVLPQFGFVESQSTNELLFRLQTCLEQLQVEDAAPSLLKRRSGPCGRPGNADSSHKCETTKQAASTSGTGDPLASGGGLRCSRIAAEAWVARRFDEIYRELTREPLDEDMLQWGDGGQACLRRMDGGGFSLFVSEQRGAAACGYGVPLTALSDGSRDTCALALLLTLSGLLAGCSDSLPSFVMLDEPDSRLDKRHASALWRLLSGPSGVKQCVVFSLNNHRAFDGIPGSIKLT